MRKKYSINFYLEKRKDKTTGEIILENIPIQMSLTFNHKRLQFYSGYRIDESKWNESEQKVKNGSINKDDETAYDINKRITKLKSAVENIFDIALALNVNITPDYLKTELRKALDEEVLTKSEFKELMDEFIDFHKNQWTTDTASKFTRISNHIQAMSAKLHMNIEMQSFNQGFFEKYIDYCQKEYGHRNSTLMKNIDLIKWFLNWVNENRSINTSVHQSFKTSKRFKNISETSNRLALSWDEITEIYNKDFESAYLNRVRDIFCFGCFTGLRYSDIKNLKKANNKGDYLDLVTIKTHDHLIIDLNVHAKKILTKYAKNPTEKCLPAISNQRMNEYLKIIGKKAKLNEPFSYVYFKGKNRIELTVPKYDLLTTHVARRSFITNALLLNIPVQIIMKWTGHKDYKTFEGYISLSPFEIRNAMGKFDQLKTKKKNDKGKNNIPD